MAATPVAGIAEINPRQVLDEPNNGRRSMKRAPPSMGHAKRSPRPLLTNIGAPFAVINRKRSLKASIVFLIGHSKTDTEIPEASRFSSTALLPGR